MATLVSNGHDLSGATAARPTNVEIGQAFFDTTLGLMLFWDGSAWRTSGGIVVQEVTFTETTGPGTYTGSVSVAAGATIHDIKVWSTALWTATTSATMKVGDAADDDGWFTGVNLKATDLLVGEELNFVQTGGKEGAYLSTTTGKRSAAYNATAVVISGIVTTVGAAGNAGRTRMQVIYALPNVAAATKA